MRILSRPSSFLATTLAWALVCASASAQEPGTAVSHWKIGGTRGSLAGALDAGDHMGRAIALLGDLDGDGVQDVAASGVADDDGVENAGAIYILFMNSDGSIKRFQKISSTAGKFGGRLDQSDQFGRALCPIGDLNGDGVIDLAVGANFDDDGGDARGAVWILFLNTNGTVKAHQKISWLEGNFTGALDDRDEFGRALAPLGDLDGDGVFDLAVGASYDDDGGINRGAIWVLFMNTDGTVKSHSKIGALSIELAGLIQDYDYFAHSLGTLGDFDGDGKGDLLVGELLDDDGALNSGAVWILFLNGDGTVKSTQKISPLHGGFTGELTERNQFGVAVAGIGDIDGDLVGDIAVGAVNDTDGGSRRGAVWILFMNAGGTVKNHRKISSSVGNFGEVLDDHDWFGSALSPLGDLDGDGFLDIAAGARQDDDSGTDAGALYMLFLYGVPAILTSEFVATPREGISPLQVAFSNQTLGAVSAWSWDFGDGEVASIQNPQHTYAAAGTYTVSLTVSGAVGSDTMTLTDHIVVHEALFAELSASSNFGIAPLDVNFNDVSMGVVTAWNWDFGDGTTSTESSSLHTYADRGIYRVTLTVTGPAGSSTATSAPIVVTLEPAVSNFGADPSSGDSPLNVQFYDQSSGVVSGWSWDFGDGATSTLQNPSHAYNYAGTYSVALTIFGPTGFNTVVQNDVIFVTPGPSLADLSFTPAKGIAPLSVQFTDLSLGGVTTWSWSFGDGGSSTLQNPMQTYVSPGTYSAVLEVNGPAGLSTKTLIDAITVLEDSVYAEFQLDHASGFAPLAVGFTDLSLGAVTTWSWDFGDGTSSNLRNPTHTYASHGTYSVSLTVVNAPTSNTTVEIDRVVVLPPPPTAALSASTTAGPAHLEVNYSDLSSGHLSSWSWNFGDGGTSNQQHPTYTYVAPGTYTVSLTATGAGGTHTISETDLIAVSTPSTASLIARPTSGHSPLVVVFSDTSAGDVSSWSWDFGDGSTSTLQHPTHIFPSPGTFPVSLAVDGAGGSDFVELVDTILVTLPSVEADFTAVTISGERPLAVSFHDLSHGNPSSWSWDFGDGNVSSEQEPTHTYLTSGTFSVTLAVVGASGSDTALINDFIFVTEPPPVVSGFSGTPTSGVAPLSVVFADESGGDIRSWTWDFGDGTSSTLANPTHTYLTIGTHSVSLAVSGPNGADLQLKPEYVVTTPVPGIITPYGCGVNPADSLQVVSGDGTLGAQMIMALDNPLGTQTPGLTPHLILALAPTPGYPCGPVRNGLGMDGGVGEILIHVGQILDVVAGTPWNGPGSPSYVIQNIPEDPALIGLAVYLQGMFIDAASDATVRNALTSAIHIQVGA